MLGLDLVCFDCGCFELFAVYLVLMSLGLLRWFRIVWCMLYGSVSVHSIWRVCLWLVLRGFADVLGGLLIFFVLCCCVGF